jgi:amidase
MGYGNDAGGSIRFPASCCGLFGLKPTRARLSFGPEYGDIFSGLAVEHALTRSVRDSRAARRPRGTRPRRPLRRPATRASLPRRGRRGPGRLRIAFCAGPFGPDGIHPDCAAAVRDSAALGDLQIEP